MNKQSATSLILELPSTELYKLAEWVEENLESPGSKTLAAELKSLVEFKKGNIVTG